MTTMIKKPVADLEGAQLDWAVAKVLGYDCAMNVKGTVDITQWSARAIGIPELLWCGAYGHASVRFSPTEQWAQGGPIIEREKIWLSDDSEGNWQASVNGPVVMQSAYNYWVGQTPLIAAMRAFVAAKLGDEVEVPK